MTAKTNKRSYEVEIFVTHGGGAHTASVHSGRQNQRCENSL